MRIPKNIIFKTVRAIVSQAGVSKKRPVIITFTGGMGAQIISAAIYMDLQQQGYDVYADFRYFDEKSRIPQAYSVWEWQLACFGLTMKGFKRYEIRNFELLNAMYIRDGPIKTRLAIQALDKSCILDIFYKHTEIFKAEIATFMNNNPNLTGSFVCVHVRRGDYLKVASHLVPEEQFLETVCKVKRLVSTIVVISDSSISNEFKEIVSNEFINTIFFDSGGLDFALSHYLMTKASILICSNSQFSWTAGKLANGMVLVPKKWFGGEDNSMENLILKNSNFLLI